MRACGSINLQSEFRDVGPLVSNRSGGLPMASRSDQVRLGSAPSCSVELLENLAAGPGTRLQVQRHPLASYSTLLCSFGWRRGRDSNPRYPRGVYRFSRPAPSTTRPPLRIVRPLPKRRRRGPKAALVDAHLLYQTSLWLGPGTRRPIVMRRMTFFRAPNIMQP